MRREGAAALVQASLTQRALSKAEETLEAARCAAEQELLLASQRIADLQRQMESAQRAQVCAAAVHVPHTRMPASCKGNRWVPSFLSFSVSGPGQQTLQTAVLGVVG